jgi:hypothetical protein
VRIDHRYALWIAVWIVLGSGVLGAQAPQAARRVWSVSISESFGFGQSSQGVTTAMQAGGFDDRSPDWFGAGRDSPYTLSEKPPTVLLMIRRRMGRIVHLRAMIGRTRLDETAGWKAGPGFGDHVSLKQSVSSLAIMAGVNTEADGGVWAAVGPALHRVALDHEEFPGGPAVTATRFGAVVAMGFVLPTGKRLFFELQGQYRLVGTVNMGPIDVLGTNGGIAGTLPRTAVSFSHAILSLGLGARF